MSIKNLIMNERFFHHYQKIYNLRDGSILGYEATLRINNYLNPENFFELAMKEKQLYELDARSIYKAIRTYLSAGYSVNDGKLFLNVLPSTLLNQNFQSLVKDIMTDKIFTRTQIVLEITEHEAVADLDNIKKVLNDLRKMGFYIAIDDWGNGIFDVQKIIEIETNYIKLDKYFSRNLSRSTKKQDVVKFLLDFCRKYKIDLILEGLETKNEILFTKLLGVEYGQGFGLSKPELLKPKLSYKVFNELYKYLDYKTLICIIFIVKKAGRKSIWGRIVKILEKEEKIFFYDVDNKKVEQIDLYQIDDIYL